MHPPVAFDAGRHGLLMSSLLCEWLLLPPLPRCRRCRRLPLAQVMVAAFSS
jgi:hypothetical protein